MSGIVFVFGLSEQDCSKIFPLDILCSLCYHGAMKCYLTPSEQREYERWRDFLYERVPFLHEDSACHAKDHCARVLLFTHLLAKKSALTRQQREVLSAASVFHDCCRFDDGRDVGHGQRAADKYRCVCGALGLKFDERVFFIMAYHDRHDREGEAAIRSNFPDAAENVIRLYRIFKDADALDRFRFGPEELDEAYLRTREARALIPFAKLLNGEEAEE